MIRLITGVAQCSVAGLWMMGLFVKPVDNVVSPVADGSANPETVRSGAEVAPVAQRRFRDPDECGTSFIVINSSSAWGSSRCRECDVVLMLVLLGSADSKGQRNTSCECSVSAGVA